ncbi:MAG: response regulator, partial [Planctomycetes bacterium]|nr:response regulator [Planctomycetota bacterium]
MQKQSQFKQFKGNILIIDDSLTNLRTLSRILTEHGYAVRNAPSGSMGLDITQRYPPDLILLDIDMEGINGYEVCRQLKNDPQTQDIPVIFVSVLAAMENKVKGLVEGGVDYITKPYRVEEILARIQVHMTLRQLQKKLEVKNTLLRQEVAVRKQTETALKEAHDELKAQYRQAQKMETVGIMTGGIAHDFNNLLTVINGYAEMMQSHLPPDAPLRDMAEKISTSGQRAADLTRQLLSYSRKQDGQPQIIGLNEVVRNLENMLRRIIGEDIMIITDLTPGKCTAKIDPVEMEQVIVNLVINARDAMPTGGRLTITTSRVALAEGDDSAALNVSPGQYAALTVSDTGCGISETDKGHIFEPFFTT